MKQYKLDIINQMGELTEEYKVISLRKTALSLGIKHLKTQECIEIMNAFIKLHPDYKAVRIMNNPLDSVFCSLCFIDKTLEFDNGENLK